MTDCDDCRHLKTKDWCKRLKKYVGQKEGNCDLFLPLRFGRTHKRRHSHPHLGHKKGRRE